MTFFALPQDWTLGIVDSHCHLDRYDDPSAVIARAHAAGVDTLVAISTSRDNFASVLPIAQQHPRVFACAGVHPCDTHLDPDPTTLKDWLMTCAQHPKVIGLGETGLDQFRDAPALEQQERLFRTHIEVAQDTGLPLVVHTRHSDAAFLRVMQEVFETCQSHGTPFPRGVLHCFTGSASCAHQAVQWGWKVSLSGIVTFKNAPEVQAMAASLPLDSLLVETDAPWLAPQTHRGKPNEPAWITETVAALADLHACSIAEMTRQTTANFYDLFSKAVRPADHPTHP